MLIALSSVLLFPAFSAHSDTDYSVVNLIELSPPTLQADAMRSDFLRGRPLYDDATGDLWVTGEKYLWRWNLNNAAVTRMELPSATQRPFSLAFSEESKLLGFDQNVLWELGRRNNNWRMIDVARKSACPFVPSTFARAVKPAFYFILSACGGAIIPNEGEVPRFFSFSSSLRDEVLSMASGQDGAGSYVVFNQKRKIFRFRTKGGKSDLEKVYESKSDLRGVVGGDSEFYAWTAKAIVVFDRQLRRKKVIPVVGQRKLAAFGVTPNFHALVFEDGTIELMAIKSKKKWYSSQSLKFAQYVDFIDDDKYLLVSAQTSQPRVFRVTTLD